MVRLTKLILLLNLFTDKLQDMKGSVQSTV